MSIDIEIMARKSEGRLFVLQPTVLGDASRRALFVGGELYAHLTGPWASEADEIRWSRLKADLDIFVTGGMVNQGYMKPLRPRRDEVWEIVSRNPRPSLRVFGSFASINVFVATHHAPRKFLGAFMSLQWQRASRRNKAIWRQLFHPYPPHTGGTIHDYISENAINDFEHWE